MYLIIYLIIQFKVNWFISKYCHSSVYIYHFNIAHVSHFFSLAFSWCDEMWRVLPHPTLPFLSSAVLILTLHSQHALLKAARLLLCFDWEENTVLPWPFLISSSALPSWLKQMEVITVRQICSIYSTHCCRLSHQPENSLSLWLSRSTVERSLCDCTGLSM